MNQEISIYDFKTPQKYSTDNMRFISVISDEFCKDINLFLADELKKSNIVCKLERVEQTNYKAFMNMISSDSVIIEHAIRPLVKGLIYQLDKSVALSLIDLTLGGDGTIDDYTRDFTEVDRELIWYLGNEFLSKMHIFEGCEYRELSNIHTKSGFSGKYPISESVIISHIKVMSGDKEIGNMKFCNPYSCMEVVIDQLEVKRLFISKEKEYDVEFTNVIHNNIHAVKTDIRAILGEANISVDEFIKLRVGDIITLDTEVNQDIELHVGGSKAFKSKPGIIKNKKGVIITDSILKDI